MKGKAVIFSAPSGAGKTTIVHSLINRLDYLRFSISATTRTIRPQEVNGKDYYFLSVNEFREKQKNGELLEWEEVYENTFYGTLKSEVDRIWAERNHVIFDVDVIGGKRLKKIFGENALSIFVKVPSLEVLRKRLQKRMTENEHSLQARIDKAETEMKEEIHFDHVIVNEVLEDAINEAEIVIRKFINQ